MVVSAGERVCVELQAPKSFGCVQNGETAFVDLARCDHDVTFVEGSRHAARGRLGKLGANDQRLRPLDDDRDRTVLSMLPLDCDPTRHRWPRTTRHDANLDFVRRQADEPGDAEILRDSLDLETLVRRKQPYIGRGRAIFEGGANQEVRPGANRQQDVARRQ